MKNVSCVIAALAALGLSAQASAAAVDLGDIAPGESQGASLFYGQMGVSIDDSWTFTLTEDSLAALVFDSADLAGFYGIADFLVAAADDVGMALAFDASDNSYSFSGVLPAGTYTIDVSGLTSGVLGAQYDVSVGALPAAAVPIPAPFALLASGLFGIGAIRRRQAKAA
jgi:hypothetical protein